jgi:membrane associated rhomboid family serine protease
MAYAVAVSASFIPVCISDRPTVGASGAVYALCGMYIAKAVSCRIGRKIKPPVNFIYFLAMLAVTLTVSFFRVNSAFHLHLFSLFIGIISYFIFLILNPLKSCRTDKLFVSLSHEKNNT